MKLIDLLVQELPKRGGWPSGVSSIEQCHNGELQAFDGFHQFGYSLELSDDWKGCVVYRGEYLSALAASQQPAWSGDGLPPVGTICEFEDKEKWLKVEVVFSSRWVIVLRSMENNAGFGVDVAIDLVKDKLADLSLRPTRTEAERKRDEFTAACVGLDNSQDWSHSMAYFDALYAAIAAGKIPGVKLTD